jgi:tetratricopeptide (TPR) repeat protein
MLVPVIGILRVGEQAYADRYTYLPIVGLMILTVWGVADQCARSRKTRRISIFISIGILFALVQMARTQTSYWKNSETLWSHALECNNENFLAHTNLGTALRKTGRINEAMPHLQRAVAIAPQSPLLRSNLAAGLILTGRTDEAISELKEAIRLLPNDASLYEKLGSALYLKGEFASVISCFEQAIRLDSEHIESRNNLAWVLATCPDPAFRNGTRAIQLAQETIRLAGRENASHLDTLAAAHAEEGDFPQAIAVAQKAVRCATPGLTEEIHQRLQGYERGVSYQEKAREGGDVKR